MENVFTYKKKELRRYCFVANDDVMPKLDSLVKKPNFKKELKEIGVEYLDCYTHGFKPFIVMETALNLDLLKLQVESRVADQINLQEILNLLDRKKYTNLERIFKKEYRKAYQKNRGSIVNDVQGLNKIVMTLSLKPDKKLLAAYKDRHSPEKVWPQIIENMNAMGINDMELYMHGNQVYLIMEVPLNFDLQKDGERWSQLPMEKEWQESMAEFQQVHPKSKVMEKWILIKNNNKQN